MNKTVLKSIFILLIGLSFILTPVRIFAEEPEVSVSLDKQSVVFGDSVLLTITVRGISQAEPPQLPEISDFEVRFAGSRQESFSSLTVIIQGRKVEQGASGGGLMFDYELIPKKKGVFNIPSFILTIAGRQYRTSEYSIEVVEANEAPEDIFLTLSADKNQVYLGEKILLTFKWYFNQNIQEYRINIPWLSGLKNFLVEDPQLDKSKRYQRLVINGNEEVIVEKKSEYYKGRQYAVVVFKKILTPMSTGEYTLEPAHLKCDVVTGYKRRQRDRFFNDFFGSDIDDFFGMGRKAITEAFSARSNSLSLMVRPLPEEGQPVSFSGAVGNFDFQVSVAPLKVKAGDPVTVTMKVSGHGNIEQIEIPQFPELPEFKGYEPETRVEAKQIGVESVGEKIFEKVLVPKKEGVYQIPPVSFSYFDSEKGRYQTITRGPFPVSVEKGLKPEKELTIVILPEGKEKKGEGIKFIKQDIRYIKTGLGVIRGEERLFYKSFVFWLWGFVPAPLIALGCFLFQRRKMRFKQDVGFARYRRAAKVASRELKSCEKLIKQVEPGNFYIEISKILNNYLADKLNCSTASMSVEVVDALRNKGIEEVVLKDVKDCYERCELVKFSKVTSNKQEMQRLLNTAKGLIAKLEKVL